MKYLLIVWCILVPLICQAQTPKPNYKLARQNTYAELSQLYTSKEVHPYWLDGSDMFIYGYRDGDEYFFYKVDPEKKSKKRLKLEIEDVDYYNHKFLYDGDTYLFNHYSGLIQKTETDEVPRQIGEWSPDAKCRAFVKENNLYVEKEGEQHQISTDGEKFYSFKDFPTNLFVDELNNADTSEQAPNVLWSPNSSFFVAYRLDARNVKDQWVMNSIAVPRPKLNSYKQRQPGEAAPKSELWIYTVKDQSFRRIEIEKWEGESYWFLDWSIDGESCFYQRIDASQTKCDVVKVDQYGTCSVIIEERPGANIFPSEFRELSNGQYIWFSRRDGWGHLYLFDSNGKLLKQLTKGDFNVEKLFEYDEELGEFLFSACGKSKLSNPYYSRLYLASTEHHHLDLLNPETADHEVIFSPSGKYFVDNYSRVNRAHRSILRGRNGRRILFLEEGSTNKLKAHGWQNPDTFRVKATDDTTNLYGVMWKPFDFDPEKKYPIITYVYPGPQDNFVPTTFFSELNNVQLAQYGFIVVMCDTRGSSYKRSLKFSEYFRTNLRDYPLADNKYMIEQLAQKHDFIDIDKVGIWGGSSGGFMAATAMLQYPDFYKVGVSRAGQHDPATFHAWWSEVFGSNPTTGKVDSLYSNLSIAHQLKGKLLLIHGESDMNVQPTHSLKLANELMKSGKHFDLLMVPGGGHGWSRNWQYVQQRI